MAIDTSLLADYSFAEIKKAAKTAMMNATLGGGMLNINGRTTIRVTIEQARALYDWADRMESAGDEGAGAALVRFGDKT